MVSFPAWVLGNPVTKSMAICSHFQDVQSSVAYVPLPLQVLVNCHRMEPKCVQLRNKHRLPFFLAVASSHEKLQLERSPVSTLLTGRFVFGKEG
ncbi:hypothetical protein Hanom_Chr09g00839161 [Helianthus anomalus]